jgi:hypothetical protein
MTTSFWSLCAVFVVTLVMFALNFVFGKARNTFRIVVNVRISSITQHIPEDQFDSQLVVGVLLSFIPRGL